MTLCKAAALGSLPDCTRPLKVAFYDMGILYEPATGQGIDRDVVEEAARRTGCHLDERFLSRVVIWHLLDIGKLDIATSGIATAARERYAKFVPYIWTRNELITKANRPFPADPQAFLADRTLRLGVVKGYKHGPGWDEWITQLRAQGRVEEAPDTHTLLARLDAGRIDAFPAHPIVAATFDDRSGMHSRLLRLPWFSTSGPTTGALVLSKMTLSPATRAGFAHAIDDMLHDGTMARIVSRYIHNPAEVRMLLKAR